MPAKAGLEAIRVSKAARKPGHLERITAPVLLLHGQQDRTTDPDAAMRAVEAMVSEEKQVVLLKRSNHMLFHDYDREEAMEAALAFLQARAEACDAAAD